MSAPNVYIDSNVFVYPVIYGRSSKATHAKKVLGMVERGEIAGYTSTLSWDEVVWVVRKFLGKPDAIQVGEKMLSFPRLRFVPVGEEVLSQAQKVMAEYGIGPRDAIHCASALNKQVESFVSDDKELDKVEEVKRESMEAFLATGK